MFSFLFVISLSNLHQNHDFISGIYENTEKDLWLQISGPHYWTRQGRPLSAKMAVRHVDFEAGFVTRSGAKMVLVPTGIFKSPNRMPGEELIPPDRNPDDVNPGFGGIYKPDAERRKFLKELSWRIVKGGERRTITLIHKGGNLEVSLGGIILTRSPDKSRSTGSKKVRSASG